MQTIFKSSVVIQPEASQPAAVNQKACAIIQAGATIASGTATVVLEGSDDGENYTKFHSESVSSATVFPVWIDLNDIGITHVRAGMTAVTDLHTSLGADVIVTVNVTGARTIGL